MKNSAIRLLVITMLVLLLLILMSVLNFSFGILLSITCLGQVLLIITVYNILKDPYSTGKTFDDLYEDHPIDKDVN